METEDIFAHNDLKDRIFNQDACLVLDKQGNIDNLSRLPYHGIIDFPSLKLENEPILTKKLRSLFPESSDANITSLIERMRDFGVSHSHNKTAPFDYTADQLIHIKAILRTVAEIPDLAAFYHTRMAERNDGGHFLCTPAKNVLRISSVETSLGKAAYTFDTGNIAISKYGTSLLEEELVHHADHALDISEKLNPARLQTERESISKLVALLKDEEHLLPTVRELIKGAPQVPHGLIAGDEKNTAKQVKRFIMDLDRSFNLRDYAIPMDELSEKAQKAEQLAHVFMRLDRDPPHFAQQTALLGKVCPYMAEACKNLQHGISKELSSPLGKRVLEKIQTETPGWLATLEAATEKAQSTELRHPL